MKITTQTLSSDLSLNEVLEITGTLTLDPNKSVTITTSKNIILTGKLVMKPTRPDIIHTIRFTNVDESKFVGGGMDVVDSDVGLWVMGAGQLDLSGTTKTAWTHAKGIKAGDTTIAADLVQGWQANDELLIHPTAAGSKIYDLRVVKSVGTGVVTLTAATTAHPAVEQWLPEVGNLTRNVLIEGTATGKSHVYIRSTLPQFIKYVRFRYMGPRKQQMGDSAKEYVLGRYACHFHHSEDGSRGSQVIGCVARDCDSHSFVPHGSNGVLLQDNQAYNVTETPFWWDYSHMSHDVVYDHNLVGLVKIPGQALDMDLFEEGGETPSKQFASKAFDLGMGDGNICRNNVVTGTTGDERAGGAYNWEANNEGIWKFINNLSHNCDNGLRVWQNTGNNHVIEDYNCYNCGTGVFHGAYANSYRYNKGNVKSPFYVHSASANTSRIRIENMTLDTIIAEGSPLPGERPILVRACTYNMLNDIVTPGDEPGVHSVDIVACTGVNKNNASLSGETLRVQPLTGQATRIMPGNKVTNISPFAPTIWGEGDGLLGEYFNTPNFTGASFTRLDNYISFDEWNNYIHHLITSKKMSVRWPAKGSAAKIMPQFSETYTFSVSSAGTANLWIDGKQVISNNKSGTISLQAGKLYDLKLEFSNNDDNLSGGINLYWGSKSLALFSGEKELIPQSQLYSGAVIVEPPPVNIKPTANAGNDTEIILPINSATLNGSGNDADGTIQAYNWTKVEGGSAVIASPNLPVTRVTGLVEGVYKFRLTVTDDKGATASDDVTVTVKPVPVFNQPPSADAGPDSEYILGVELKGKATDIDGTITSVLWELVSGPGVAPILQPSQLETKAMPTVSGTYKFKLTVKDNAGAVVSDEKIVYVR